LTDCSEGKNSKGGSDFFSRQQFPGGACAQERFKLEELKITPGASERAFFM
jgi:hypothetical protein